jgi:hypothetical protein
LRVLLKLTSSSIDFKKPKKSFKDYNWTPLNALITKVLMEVKRYPTYQKLRSILGSHPLELQTCTVPFMSNDHNTEGCISLRLLIEKFIENGKLVRFLVTQRNQQDQARPQQPRRDQDQEPRR